MSSLHKELKLWPSGAPNPPPIIARDSQGPITDGIHRRQNALIFMPQFYFDVSSEGKLHPDSVGSTLPDMDAAMAEATDLALMFGPEQLSAAGGVTVGIRVEGRGVILLVSALLSYSVKN